MFDFIINNRSPEESKGKKNVLRIMKNVFFTGKKTYSENYFNYSMIIILRNSEWWDGDSLIVPSAYLPHPDYAVNSKCKFSHFGRLANKGVQWYHLLTKYE